jgi:hypothetical protein
MSLAGNAVLLLSRRKFLNHRFLPVYGRLVRLCNETGVSCSMNLQALRRIIALSITSLVLSGALVLAAGDVHPFISLCGILSQIGFTVGLVLLPRLMTQIQDEADFVLRQLRYGIVQRQSDLPPAAAKFLLLLVPLRYREHLIGDLQEEYATVVLPEYGFRKARFWYWWQVVASVIPLLWTELKRTASVVAVWKRII